jgi:spore coat polysaccharide biosynthesis protein SpsF (cytidylyltransferase family)
MGMPLGTGVEVVQVSALERARREATAEDEREHMTTHVYRHCAEYRISEWYAPRCLTFMGADVSVDSPADYERTKRMFADLHRGTPIELPAVIGWLRSHPDMVRMREIVY